MVFWFIRTAVRKIATIFLFTFYLSGVMLFPMGDFSCMRDLPEMFRHCRDTEDPDLNVFEFLTEHVSAIGQLIEGMDHDDEEEDDKPHVPVAYHSQVQINYTVQRFAAKLDKPVISIPKVFAPVTEQVYISTYTASIFRPPIV